MFTASLASRVPASSGPPTLTEIDGLVAPSGVKLTETLNEPEALEFELVPSVQSSAILARFLDLALQGTEVWAHRGSGQVYAGALVGYSPKLVEGTIIWSVRSAGLLDYFRRWRIEPDGSDLVYSSVDQANIAKGLVDYYQALSYGHYGIDTSGVSTTGVTRKRTYEAIEAAPISQRLAELAAVNNGFDFYVEPDTRALVVAYPQRGIDRSATVQVDGRSIISPDAQISIGPEDLVSEGFAVGDDGLVGHATNTGLRQSWGRTGFASGFSGVSEQQTIDDHAQRMVDQRATQLHIPPRAMYPIVIQWEDFGVGDLVEFVYDYGAGNMVELRRIYSRTLTIGPGGTETIEVQFL